MTHDELCGRAARWLRNTRQCRLVLREVVSYAMENPDVIGWRWGYSTLVECKVSRADFARDKRKAARRFESWGMGQKRYYMTPPGLIRTNELPEGWGLLEAHNKTVRVIKEATQRDLEPRFYRDEIQHCIRGVRMANGQDKLPTKRSETLVHNRIVRIARVLRQLDRTHEVRVANNTCAPGTDEWFKMYERWEQRSELRSRLVAEALKELEGDG